MVTPQDFASEFWNAYETNGVEYQAFVLRNSNGDDPVLQDLRGFGYLLTMVSKKTKHPEKIIKLLHFLYSEEGQRFVHYGLEGETWEWEEKPTDSSFGKIKFTEKFQAERENQDTAKYGFGPYLLANYAYIRLIEPSGNRTERDIYIENLKLPLSPYTADYNPSFFQVDASDPEYSDYMDKVTAVNAVWDQYRGLLITTKDFENEYQKVMKLLEQEGQDFIAEFAAKYYAKWKERMGYEWGWAPNDPNYKSPEWTINGDESWKISK